MSSPRTVIGFDASLDDVALVVMTRGHDGVWRVESTDGPDAAELRRWAERFAQRHNPKPAPLPAEPSLGEQVVAWISEYAERDSPFQFTEEQRALVTAMYDRMVHEGTLCSAPRSRTQGPRRRDL